MKTIMYGVNDQKHKFSENLTAIIDKVFVEPEFTPLNGYVRDDIALIKLRHHLNITFNGDGFVVNTVCLPRDNSEPLGEYNFIGVLAKLLDNEGVFEILGMGKGG